MTISELAAISGVKESSVRRSIDRIAGTVVDNKGNVTIPAGSRYPYDVHRYKFDTIEKRRLALLDATYHFRYVDHTALHMSAESFETMLAELLCAGYLQPNGSNNEFGANQYDTTLEYERIREMTQFSKMKKIADAISSAAGHFVGAIENELATV